MLRNAPWALFLMLTCGGCAVAVNYCGYSAAEQGGGGSAGHGTAGAGATTSSSATGGSSASSMSASGSGGSTSSSGTGGTGGATAHCSDGARDDGETDVDCGGGICPACANGKGCETGADCQSLSCPNHTCVAPQCADMIQNGNETDVDCGGPDCPGCANGKMCLLGADCASHTCAMSACVPWAVAMSAGSDHACAVQASGAIVCWGGNFKGQLGDGTTTDRSSPVVTGAQSGYVKVTGGGEHTCGLTAAGQVMCWGSNAYGQLGDGTFNDSSSPVAVSGLANGVTEVSAGYDHTCAVTASGAAKCWGDNSNGQLGNSSTVMSAVPVQVTGLTSGTAHISAGVAFTCAVTTQGDVKCWGVNSVGELGNGSTTDRHAPVATLTGCTSVSAGSGHACAIDTFGGVSCWGSNSNGQLGNGTTVNSSYPVKVFGLMAGATAIAAGGEDTVAVVGGAAKDWGQYPGNGTNGNRTKPTAVTGLSTGATLGSVGAQHACVLTNSGDVWCWGANDRGQLGNGSLSDTNVPVEVVEAPTP